METCVCVVRRPPREKMCQLAATYLNRTANHNHTHTGAILTKLDGDTRGGAALSVRGVSGKPIKVRCPCMIVHVCIAHDGFQMDWLSYTKSKLQTHRQTNPTPNSSSAWARRWRSSSPSTRTAWPPASSAWCVRASRKGGHDRTHNRRLFGGSNCGRGFA